MAVPGALAFAAAPVATRPSALGRSGAHAAGSAAEQPASSQGVRVEAVCGSAALASGAAVASLARSRRQRRRQGRLATAVRLAASEDEVQGGQERAEVGELSPAWEKALSGLDGDVFSEPGSFRQLVGPFSDAPGDESVGSVRYERVGGKSDSDLLLFVPGIDFAGVFAAPQFRRLSAEYELWRCFVGSDDRTPFVQLVDSLEKWLSAHVDSGRRVVLAGESFGGLLALAVALRLGSKLGGLVLVNPATSFGRSTWPLLARAVLSIPEGEKPTEAMGPAETIGELLDGVQKRAVEQPYAYIGSTALMSAVIDGAQFGKIASLIATSALDEQASPGSPPSKFLQEFTTFPEDIAKLLPASTLRFRLRAWLRDGCELVDSDLRARSGRAGSLPPTALICSEEDRFIPSKAEGERLLPLLRARCSSGRAELVELPGMGHAPLDARVDLAKLIRESTVGAAVKTSTDYVSSWKQPTMEQVERGSESVEGLAQITSPVFLSTGPDGARSFGLEGVPDPRELGRPVLLVGNHQLLALDLGPLVREFLVEKGFAPRGLAHPINFPDLLASGMAPEAPETPNPSLLDAAGLPFELRSAARSSLDAARSFLQPDDEEGGSGKGKGKGGGKGRGRGRSEEGGNADNGPLGGGIGDFRKWGAVPVTPRNFVKLLQQGEAVLLFPGGASEALHGRSEKYQLLWPEKTDFVRAAAKFNAVVVPFGSVGGADNLQYIPEDWGALEPVRQTLPFWLGGPVPREMQRETSRAAQAAAASGMGGAESSRLQLRYPGVLPQTKPATQAQAGFGDRFYFSFGAPVDLKDLDPKDAEACAIAYADLKSSVEHEIDYLLRARVKDPYRDFVRRQVYERTAKAGGGEKPRKVEGGPNKGGVVRSYGPRAPSFSLEEAV